MDAYVQPYGDEGAASVKTIRLIAFVLAVVGAALFGQGQHTALADGEWGTLYIDVQPDANNTTTGFGDIDVCRDTEDIGDGSGDDDGLLEVGERFSIDVVIEGAPDINGAGHELNYEPSVLKVTASDWASWKFGSGMLAEDVLPDTDGTFYTSYEGNTTSGDGVIQRLTLEAVGNGQSDLDFTYIEGTDGTPIIEDLGVLHYPPEVLVDNPPGDVRVVVGGLCPSPVGAVGGIAEIPHVSDSAATNHIGLAALAGLAVVALTAGGWYARRRWLR
jgi:hypothetical protein